MHQNTTYFTGTYVLQSCQNRNSNIEGYLAQYIPYTFNLLSLLFHAHMTNSSAPSHQKKFQVRAIVYLIDIVCRHLQHIFFVVFLQSYYKIVRLLSVSLLYIIGVKITFLDIAVDLLQKVPNSCGQEIINAINSVHIAYVISVLIFGCSQTQITNQSQLLLLVAIFWQLTTIQKSNFQKKVLNSKKS